MGDDAMEVDGSSGSFSFSSFPLVEEFFEKILKKPDEDSPSSALAFRLEVDLRQKCTRLLQSVIMEQEGLESIETFWNEALQASYRIVSALAHDSPSERTCGLEHLTPVVVHIQKLPIILLEDILETLDTESAFCFWKRVIQTTSPLFCKLMWHPEPKKHPCWLPFLKAANSLLRRLRAEGATNEALGCSPQSVVLQALSCVYPVSELKSTSRALDNAATLESETEFEDQREAVSEVETKEKVGKQKPAPSYSFYRSLWMLQHDFRNPNGMSPLEFMRRLTTVLRSFQSHSCETNAVQIVNGSHLAMYATQSRLLPIQLKDPAIRTAMLIQFWIVACYINSHIPSLKKQLEPHFKTAETLLPAEYLDLLKNSAIFELSEKQWSDWKRTKCKHDLDEVKTPAPSTSRKRKRLEITESTQEAEKNGSSTEEISKQMRASEPSIKDYMEPYIDAIDPEAGIEEEYHPGKNAVFSWRALRLLRAGHLDKVSDVQPDGDYEILVRHLYKSDYDIDIPGACPEPFTLPEEAEEKEDQAIEMEVEEQVKTEEDQDRKDDDEKPEMNGHTKVADVVMKECPTRQEESVKPPSSDVPSENKETRATSNVKVEEEDTSVPFGPSNREDTPVEPMKKTAVKTEESIPKSPSGQKQVKLEGGSAKQMPESPGKSKKLDFREPPPKDGGQRRNAEPPPEAHQRRGHPQFQPRAPERRDVRPRLDDRKAAPDERARINEDRGRMGDRQRHHDDRGRDRSRHDDRRGEPPRRGDDRRGDRNWRQGERRPR